MSDASGIPPSISGSKRPFDKSDIADKLDAVTVKRVKLDSDSTRELEKQTAMSAETEKESEVQENSEAKSLKAKGGHMRDAAGYPKSRKGKEKDGKNVGRRQRGPRTTETLDKTHETEEQPGEGSVPKALRLPKRQCALKIGFCGTGCNGMQIQPDVKTIEGVLFDALVKAGAVSQDNADDPVKVNLGRAARTDAGVHAAGNLVSIKLITTIPGVDDIVARINEELPPEIRVWGYVRVQNSFNARLSCDSRKYTYFFPSYLLIPPKPDSSLYKALQHHAESLQIPFGTGIWPSFWNEENAGESTLEDELRRKRQWRIKQVHIDSLRETAHKFEGTHNFHNFTIGREFSDRSSQRHMKKIEVSDPVVYGDTEWISVLFHGQSFMLHQRKMMFALVLSCRMGIPSRIIDELYGPRMVCIPKMPSLGLLLEEPIFDSYNKKVRALNEKLQPTDADFRPVIDFDIHRETIEKFKQEHIYENMRSIEDRDGVFNSWVHSVDSYGGDDLLWLNAKAVIPAAAVVKKGEKRDNVFRDKKRFDATKFVDGTKELSGEKDEDEDEDAVTLNKARLEDMES